MTNQNDRYLKQPRNRNVWMYQRAIPEDMQRFHGGRKTINRSCGTERKSIARRLRDQWAEADTKFWKAMRSGQDAASVRERYEAALVVSEHLEISFNDPITFQEAMEINQVDRWIENNQKIDKLTNPDGKQYSREELPKALETKKKLRKLAFGKVDKPVENVDDAKERWLNDVILDEWIGKSPEQKRNHRVPINRAVENYKKVVKPKGAFLETSRADALKFHAWLNGRVISKDLSFSSANRDMGVLRRVFRDLAHRDQLLAQNPFEGLTWRQPKANRAGVVKKVRKPFSTDWLVSKFTMKDSLKGLNSEARAVIYVLIETGARPSEVINLHPDNIHLDADIPHFQIKAMEGREIKTAASARDVPLVGVALEAMRQFPQGFDRYKDKDSGFSQVAMKYLRNNDLMENENNYVYSFRHSYVDRLRQTGAQRDLRESIVGHDDGGSHGGYGEGFTLKDKYELMQSIVLPFDKKIFLQKD